MERDAGEQEALGNYAEIHLYNLFKGEVPTHTRKTKQNKTKLLYEKEKN